MEIKQQKRDNISILELIGRLDANTSGQLEKTLIPLIEDGEKSIILDFSNLEYISSAGLRILLLAAKMQKKSQGKIILCAMKDFIKEIFEIAGFTPIFTICDSLELALKECE